MAAVFTGRQAYLGNKQLRAARDALATAQDTEKRQLRAYLLVQSVVWFPARLTPQFQITFLNGGQTPAYKARINTRIEILPYPLDRPIQEYNEITERKMHGRVTQNRSMIYKDQSVNGGGQRDDFESNWISNIINDKMLYVWGEISYNDVFTPGEHFYFCFRWDREHYLTHRYEYCDTYNGPSQD